MEELNILTFVDEYEKAENKQVVFKKIKIESYVDFLVKKVTIETIIDNFLEVENGLYTYDTMNKHLCFTLGFISTYTNLSYKDDEGYQSYDALMRNGLIDQIIESIGYDYSDFVVLFEEELKTRIGANNSVPFVLNNFLIGITAAISGLDAEKLDTVLKNIE